MADMDSNPYFAGMGRIFAEFDEFLRMASDRRQGRMEKLRGKSKKRFVNLLENFFEETACLLNIDRADVEEGRLPWCLIFYHRMICQQSVLSAAEHGAYVAAVSDYLEAVGDKGRRGRRGFYNSARGLLQHLRHHEMDPDNALLGLPPSPGLLHKLQQWAAAPCDHEREARQQQQEAAASQQPADARALHCFSFPARRGDLVLALVRPEDVADVEEAQAAHLDLRRTRSLQASGGAGGGLVARFARIKDAVEFNRKPFLKLNFAPNEQHDVTVDGARCLPLRRLVPDAAWFGQARTMKEMVTNPFTQFFRYLEAGFASILERLLEGRVPVAVLHEALQVAPVSFAYYHHLIEAEPVFSALAQPDTPASEAALPGCRALLARLHDEARAWGQQECASFMDEISTESDSARSNKIFMATSSEDLGRFRSISFADSVATLLEELAGGTRKAVTAMEGEVGELMNGNLKNQISKWWLLLIKTKTELLLAEVGYDTAAVSEDTYIDNPPEDMAAVKANLALVQDLLNAKHPLHAHVLRNTEELKREVYPVIDDFILKAHTVLSKMLLGEKLPLDYSPDTFDLHGLMRQYAEGREALEFSLGAGTTKQLGDLLKDLEYLTEMKLLEQQAESNLQDGTQAKLELSKAVPLSGLVMGAFFQKENVLKTVIELFDVAPRKPSPDAAEREAEAPAAAAAPPPTPPAAATSAGDEAADGGDEKKRRKPHRERSHKADRSRKERAKDGKEGKERTKNGKEGKERAKDGKEGKERVKDTKEGKEEKEGSKERPKERSKERAKEGKERPKRKASSRRTKYKFATERPGRAASSRPAAPMASAPSGLLAVQPMDRGLLAVQPVDRGRSASMSAGDRPAVRAAPLACPLEALPPPAAPAPPARPARPQPPAPHKPTPHEEDDEELPDLELPDLELPDLELPEPPAVQQQQEEQPDHLQHDHQQQHQQQHQQPEEEQQEAGQELPEGQHVQEAHAQEDGGQEEDEPGAGEETATVAAVPAVRRRPLPSIPTPDPPSAGAEKAPPPPLPACSPGTPTGRRPPPLGKRRPAPVPSP